MELEDVRKVRMTVELMDALAEAALGRRAVIDWGQPDTDGFYSPTITVHREIEAVTYDGKPLDTRSPEDV